jgi:flagellin
LLGGTYSGETFQVGPYDSANDQVVVTIAAATSTALAVNTAAVSIGTVSAAEAAMTAVQTAISTVASQAASVGATQNQIQALASNLTTAQQNIESAHANLVDVNVAQETAAFTSDQILEQSGVAILAQAEQLPSLALKLLS